MQIEIDLLGAHPAQARIHGIAERLMAQEPAFSEVMGVLEEGERRIFEAWHGKYVDTGALRDSLTLPDADGALREIHNDGVDFGTLIPYAVYQRDNGRSAIMRFDDAEIAEITAILLRYIVEGPEGM